MDKNKIPETALINQLEYLKDNCEKIKGQSCAVLLNKKDTPWMYSSLCQEVDVLIKEYNWVVDPLNDFLKEKGFSSELEELPFVKASFEEMRDDNKYPPVDGKLMNLSLKCNKILSIIKNLSTPTRENKKNFEDLKEEINEMKKDISKNVLRDLYEVIGDLELNRRLGAVLICGRIIIFHLNSVPGDINEKIKKIKETEILETKGSSEWVIKANQKSRGLFSHDLNYFPTPSEAISILGDTVKIVKIVTHYHKVIEKKLRGSLEKIEEDKAREMLGGKSEAGQPILYGKTPEENLELLKGYGGKGIEEMRKKLRKEIEEKVK